jgi:hypothetical protein
MPTPLQQLIDAPGAPASNWHEICNEINKEFDHATPEHRIALLQLLHSTMDIVSRYIAPEDMEKFTEARRKQHRILVVQESVVGVNACVETLDAVTQREVAAGRMAPDDELRQLAITGMAAPHPSRAELEAVAAQEQRPKESGTLSRAMKWLRGA